MCYKLSSLKIINSKKNSFKTKTVVTIGTFDGVHIGHQKIIQRLINSARNANLNSVILTFFPHPRMVLQKDANLKLINTLEEKANILDNLGLDYLVIKEFTNEFSRLSAKDFVSKTLIDELNAKKVIIGYDHHFGRNRSANIDDLKAFGLTHSFEVEEISAQDINNVAISSTKIREALRDGNIETANQYLGYNYMITGEIIKGKKLGRQISFPTANLFVKENYKLIPRYGAYIISSEIENKRVFGMMNIGLNPTVDGKKENLEIHFFDFDKDLYGETIQVDLLHRIRDEQKFESVNELSLQLKKDKETALNYIKSHYAK